MKNIIVTGGAGFVGSALIRKLVERYPQAKITSIDCYLTGKQSNHVISPNVSYRYGLSRNIGRMGIKADVVFHLGEYARIVQSFDEPGKCLNYNLGTAEVIEYCRQENAKLIYSGSSSKFGNDGEDQHLSPYAWSKAKNTELIKNYHKWFGLEYVITYFYNVYGPGQIMEGEYATVIGIFENQYLRGEPLSVVKPGTQTRDFTHIEDIVNGIILAAEGESNQEYSLGSGTSHRLIDVAQYFECPLEMIPERRGERTDSRAEYTAAERNLGWKAKHKLEDYIKDFIKNNPHGVQRKI